MSRRIEEEPSPYEVIDDELRHLCSRVKRLSTAPVLRKECWEQIDQWLDMRNELRKMENGGEI